MNIQPVNISVLKSVVLAMVVVLLATACAEPSEKVSKRAQERWDLLVEQKYADAYEYLAPGYRSSVSVEAYMRQMLLRRVGWTGVEVKSADCEEDRCTVSLSISYVVRNPVPGVDVYENTQNAEETWIRSRGKWWFMPAR